MSDQRRLIWISGRLVSTPVTDFLQISPTVQDPPIPNLPLETPAAPPAAPDPIVSSWWTVDDDGHDDGDHEGFYSTVYEAIAQAYDLVEAVLDEAEGDGEDEAGGAFQVIGENAPITGVCDTLEEEEDAVDVVLAGIRETIVAANDFVAGLFDVDLGDDLDIDIECFTGVVPDGGVVPPQPTPAGPAGFWAANPYRRRGKRKPDDDEITPLEAVRVIQSVATKRRDIARAERLERMLLGNSEEDLGRQVEWAIERARFLRQRDDEDLAMVLMLLQ